MVTWDDAIDNCQDLGSDTSADALTFFKRMMNVGYKLSLAEIGRPAIEKTSSGLVTAALTNSVDLPQDCLFPKSITITVGGRNLPIVEEESQQIWDAMNEYTQYSDEIQKYFVRNNFGIGHSQILLYPIPSSASLPVNVVYEAIDRDLSNDAYVTGTVALTNGDKTVTITTGAFTAAMVGRYLKGSDGYFYKIASWTSAAVVELDHAYEGTTDATATVGIYEMFNLPEEMQILPCYFALAHYFGMKKDVNQETKYWTLYQSGVALGKIRWGTKTRSSLTRGQGWTSRFRTWAPPFFPASAS
jgi:hypothetical protein